MFLLFLLLLKSFSPSIPYAMVGSRPCNIVIITHVYQTVVDSVGKTKKAPETETNVGASHIASVSYTEHIIDHTGRFCVCLFVGRYAVKVCFQEGLNLVMMGALS